MPESSNSYTSVPRSSDIELQGFEYLYAISPVGRVLPSSSKWNSIEFDFSILPKSSLSEPDSLASRYSKNVDFDLVVTDKAYFKRFIYICACIVFVIVALVLVIHFWPHKHVNSGNSKDLKLALSKARLFFDAQKSGYYPKDSLVNFRGDSGTNDGNTSSMNVDLIGGFYDSGNDIKYSFSTAYTVTLLSWTVIEYHEKYDHIGELEHVKDILKWGSDYLLKIFAVSNTSTSSQAILYSQVGSSGNEAENDINCWQRPEDMTYTRPIFVCHDIAPDLAGEIIAAYAATSIVLKDDTRYSKKLIKSAENLFNIAILVDIKQRDTYTADENCGGQARKFYNSSGYKDELVWGGIWLFFATGNFTYLEYATSNFIAAEKEELVHEKGIFYWNNKLTAAQVLLTRLWFFRDLGYPYEDAFRSASNTTDLLICSYLWNLNFERTEGGLILLKPDHSGPLQYAATASLLSKLYSDYLHLLQRSGSECSVSIQMMRNFSMSQVNYILGENPMKMSYIVGYGDKYPNQVHHRAASIPWDNQTYSCEEGNSKFLKSQNPNPNIINGAMVAGPDKNDVFLDIREKSEFTEPTIASNAG